MSRVDTRLALHEMPLWKQADGWWYEYPPPDRLSDLAVLTTQALVRRFSARFAALGKPFKYVLLIVGPDSANPAVPGQENAVVICTSTTDGFDWTTKRTILFRNAGAQQGKAYFEGTPSNPGVFPRLKTALEAAGLPLPIMGLANIESRGDWIGSYPYGLNVASYFPDPVAPGLGFFETRIKPNDPSNMWLVEPLTVSQTLGQWLSERTQTQNGSTLDPFDPPLQVNATYPSNPINRVALSLAFSAVTANFASAIATAIFQPFKAVFGSDAPCGEWDIYCTTQDHQAPFYPIGRYHQFGDDLPIDRQIIKNYSDLPYQEESIGANGGSNLDWPTAWNWLQVYQPAGFTPWTTYPTDPPPDLASEPMQRVVLDSQTRYAKACASAAPHIPLMPSISIGFRQLLSEPAGTQEARRKAAIPYTVRYMLNCCALGAREFYLFASEWNTGQPGPPDAPNLAPVPGELIRTSNHELINTFNKRFKARLPMRNRTWRFSA